MNLTGYKPNSKSLVQYFLPMTWLVTNLFQRLWYSIFHQWHNWLQTCFKDFGAVFFTNDMSGYKPVSKTWVHFSPPITLQFLSALVEQTWIISVLAISSYSMTHSWNWAAAFVVYFDQKTGAAHRICGSIYVTDEAGTSSWRIVSN